MAGPLLAPGVEELVDRLRNPHAAVRVADVEDVAGHDFAHRVDQFERLAGVELREIQAA